MNIEQAVIPAGQFRREKLYQAALTLAKTMLEKRLLTDDEHLTTVTILREKYRPALAGLDPVQVP
jgi:hypothetical protein